MLESYVQKIADILAPLVKRRGSGWAKEFTLFFLGRNARRYDEMGRLKFFFIAFFQQEKYVPHIVKIMNFYSHYSFEKIP